MLSISARRSLNQWDNNSIRPGPVGSVGDANVNVTFKSSLPGDYREAPYTAGDLEQKYGSNVQDGQKDSWETGFGSPRVYDNFFGGDRDSMTTQRGWMFQNISPEDMADEPIMGELPRYGWRNQVATVNTSLRTGDQFSQLPGGYTPIWGGMGKIPRGGNVPGVVDREGNIENQRFTFNRDPEVANMKLSTSTPPSIARSPQQEININPIRLGNAPPQPQSWNKWAYNLVRRL